MTGCFESKLFTTSFVVCAKQRLWQGGSSIRQPVSNAVSVVSLAFVLVFSLMARFYQRFATERTHFEFFVVPILLFGAALMRYASIGHICKEEDFSR